MAAKTKVVSIPGFGTLPKEIHREVLSSLIPLELGRVAQTGKSQLARERVFVEPCKNHLVCAQVIGDGRLHKLPAGTTSRTRKTSTYPFQKDCQSFCEDSLRIEIMNEIQSALTEKCAQLSQGSLAWEERKHEYGLKISEFNIDQISIQIAIIGKIRENEMCTHKWLLETYPQHFEKSQYGWETKLPTLKIENKFIDYRLQLTFTNPSYYSEETSKRIIPKKAEGKEEEKQTHPYLYTYQKPREIEMTSSEVVKIFNDIKDALLHDLSSEEPTDWWAKERRRKTMENIELYNILISWIQEYASDTETATEEKKREKTKPSAWFQIISSSGWTSGLVLTIQDPNVLWPAFYALYHYFLSESFLTTWFEQATEKCNSITENQILEWLKEIKDDDIPAWEWDFPLTPEVKSFLLIEAPSAWKRFYTSEEEEKSTQEKSLREWEIYLIIPNVSSRIGRFLWTANIPSWMMPYSYLSPEEEKKQKKLSWQDIHPSLSNDVILSGKNPRFNSLMQALFVLFQHYVYSYSTGEDIEKDTSTNKNNVIWRGKLSDPFLERGLKTLIDLLNSAEYDTKSKQLRVHLLATSKLEELKQFLCPLFNTESQGYAGYAGIATPLFRPISTTSMNSLKNIPREIPLWSKTPLTQDEYERQNEKYATQRRKEERESEQQRKKDMYLEYLNKFAKQLR